MRAVGRVMLGILVGFWVSQVSAQITVYEHDFDSPVGYEWSEGSRSTTPNHARTFLGEFSGENVVLNLELLPDHCSVTVSFDLLIIGSWEGSTGYFAGPDTFDVDASVPGDCCPVKNLLHASFANCSCRYQSYPDTYPNVYHPGLTGAEEVESLGYGDTMDSVYHMSFTFYHWRDTLQLSFAGNQGLQGVNDESWGLDNLVVEVNSNSCCRATRTLPSVLIPRTEIPVQIDVQPNPEAHAWVVEENPNSDWVVSNITNGGVFDEVSGLIKWGPFYGSDPKVLSYTAAVPGGAMGTAHFWGSISIDGVKEAICGDTEVSGGGFHPADLNNDWNISGPEVTAYAASWLVGDPWSRDPEVIPADFVTNAGMLWRSGGDYIFKTATNPPWVPATGGKQGRGSLISNIERPVISAGVPVRVTLEAYPQEGTSSYLVEEHIPEGLAIHDAGTGVFDASTRVLRFGPFFDDQERQLSFELTSAENRSVVVDLDASASFDGTQILASGVRSIRILTLHEHTGSSVD